MTYEEALSFIESMPKFSPAAMAAGEQPFELTTIRELLKRLGNPQDQLHFVHIAGTNGKGSTASFMRSILTKARYKTGLYTSPAIERFTERIRIDEAEIGEEDLGRITGIVYEKYQEMERDGLPLPSEFEVVCAVAFLYFAEQQCDAVVLEVGMGGTRDATNVIGVPDLAMITTISLDHTGILGDTLPQIAGEKAGIIKENGLVLVYPQAKEVEDVFAAVCADKHAEMVRAAMPDIDNVERSLEGQVFDLGQQKGLTISLLGTYQIYNASMAACGAALLRDKKGYHISDEAIREGLKASVWPGRFELMHRAPAVIVDGGHNEEGATVLKNSLKTYFPDQKIHFVTGVLADKAYGDMMGQVLPLAERFYCVTPDNPRALSAGDLAAYLENHGAKAEAHRSIPEALNAAVEAAGEDGVVCVFGSLYYLGEVRRHFMSK